MTWERWGIQVGRWHLTWWDLWEHRPCFEVVREPFTDWDRWEKQ